MRIRNIPKYIFGYMRSKKFIKPPVIIGGCERSGTTLLQAILSAFPSIFVCDEELWSFCYSKAAGFDNDNPIKISRLYKYFGENSIPDDCNRWCEKSPANIFYFDEILNYFDHNVKLIQIVRDGRDVITSMHPASKTKPHVSVERWVGAIEAGLKYKNNPNVLTIKYEDLILNYDFTIKSICDYLEEKYDDRLLEWDKYATVKSSSNIIGGSLGKIASNSIGKFNSDDFKYKSYVEGFMNNERAVSLLKIYNYID